MKVRQTHGMSLLEVMIAMLIAIAGAGAALAIFELHNQQTFSGYITQELQASNRLTYFMTSAALKNAGAGLDNAAAFSPANQLTYGSGTANDPLTWDGPPVLFTAGNPTSPKPDTDAVLAVTADLSCGGLAATNPDVVDLEHFVDTTGLTNQADGQMDILRVCLPAPNCLNQTLVALDPEIIMIQSTAPGFNGAFFVQKAGDPNQATNLFCGGRPHTWFPIRHLPEYNLLGRGGPLAPNQTIASVVTGGAYLYHITNSNQFVRLAIRANPQIAHRDALSVAAEDLQITYNLAIANLNPYFPPVPTCTGSGDGACPFAPWNIADNPSLIRLVRYEIVHAQLDASGYRNLGQPFSISDHPSSGIADSLRRRRHLTQVFTRNQLL